MLEVKVRLAEKSDIPAIVRIGQEWIPFNSDALLQRYRSLEKNFESMTSEGYRHAIFVAEKDSVVIGWIDLIIRKDWFMLRKTIHIKHIVVLAEYRDQGVGTQMLNEVFNYFKDKEEDMYVILWYSESSWNGFFEKHNHMQNTGQNLFYKLIEKKKRGVT